MGHQGYLGTVMAPVLAAAGHEVLGLDFGFFAGWVLGPTPQDPPGLAMDLRRPTLLPRGLLGGTSSAARVPAPMVYRGRHP